MIKKVLLTALAVVFEVMVVGCQKETTIGNPPDPPYVDASVCVVKYSIDGVMRTATLGTKADLCLFVEGLLDLAEVGNKIVFYGYGSGNDQPGSKDVVRFVSEDKKEVAAWIMKMSADGYEVEVDFVDGKYVCIAKK